MAPLAKKRILASLVTFNDEQFLGACLSSLQGQTVLLHIRIFDNASQDRTRQVAAQFQLPVHRSDRNRGYSFGHNYNLQRAEFDFALLLNADVILQPDYVERVTEALEQVPRAGMAGGKLYRMDGRGHLVLRKQWRVLDSTGIYFTPTQRHFDRGSGETDIGQYDRRQRVFGITGAALFCSRELLEDVRCGRQYLDQDFFIYREDADLAWRARLRGWEAVYEPLAEAFHHRHVLPSRRRRLSADINYHSLKNRYLMRLKNMDASVRRRCFPYMWLRDLGVVFYVLLMERNSLASYREVWRLRKRFLVKRGRIERRRTVGSDEMARWFRFAPVALDFKREF